jgi:hypothetical protein
MPPAGTGSRLVALENQGQVSALFLGGAELEIFPLENRKYAMVRDNVSNSQTVADLGYFSYLHPPRRFFLI